MTFNECFAAILVAACAYLTAPEDIQKNLATQVHPVSLVTAASIEYSNWMIATAAHEYGHANMAQRLGGGRATIHLGGNSQNKKAEPLLSVGPFHLTGFNPCFGHTNYSKINHYELQRRVYEYTSQRIDPGKTSLSKHELRDILSSDVFEQLCAESKLSIDDQHKILFIGGICGLLARIGIQVLTERSFTPDFIMVHELFNSLLPLAPGSDAYIIWQERFELSEEQLDKIIYLTTLLDISAFIFFTATDKRNAPHAPLHTKALLGLVNYFIRGYGKFYAGSNNPMLTPEE